ncbi:MAG: peptide chain release factor N(5)-glutamine methyltransferase [Lachnospiraceae bacterium]|nr:peptide chain release factor N(5)-glutamine methyltransferase [Lachnospiraceae bacterium]
MTYQEIIKKITDELKTAGVPDPETDARFFLEEAAGTDYSHLLMQLRDEVPDEVSASLEKYIEARKHRIPLQQILGFTEFMGLKFYVNEHVLCPRQDTEVLIEQILKNDIGGSRVLDLCTGSGCIAVSLAKLGGADVTATDISEEALTVAARNAQENEVDVHFFRGDLYDALPSDEKYDIIVSNPPYIRTQVIDTLAPEVRDHEPRIALDGDADGLAFYRRIINDAGTYLNEGGRLYFEIGFDQGKAVSELLRNNAYEDIHVIKDYSHNDRVVAAKRRAVVAQVMTNDT